MIKLSISADADRWLLSYLGALPFFLLAFDPADPALCPSLTATQGQMKPRMLLPRRPHLSIDVSQSLNMSIIASDCGRHGVPPPLRSLAARLVPPNRIAPDGRPTFLGRQFRQRRRLTRPRPTSCPRWEMNGLSIWETDQLTKRAASRPPSTKRARYARESLVTFGHWLTHAVSDLIDGVTREVD